MPNPFSFLRTSLSILVWGSGVLGFSNGSIDVRVPRLPRATAKTAARSRSDFISRDPIGGFRPQSSSMSYNPPRHLTPEVAEGSPVFPARHVRVIIGNAASFGRRACPRPRWRAHSAGRWPPAIVTFSIWLPIYIPLLHGHSEIGVGPGPNLRPLRLVAGVAAARDNSASFGFLVKRRRSRTPCSRVPRPRVKHL